MKNNLTTAYYLLLFDMSASIAAMIFAAVHHDFVWMGVFGIFSIVCMLMMRRCAKLIVDSRKAPEPETSEPEGKECP